MERLYRAYASPDWMTEFPNMRIQNFPMLHSDHALIFLQASQQFKMKRRPHQIENWRLNKAEVRKIIEEL